MSTSEVGISDQFKQLVAAGSVIHDTANPWLTRGYRINSSLPNRKWFDRVSQDFIGSCMDLAQMRWNGWLQTGVVSVRAVEITFYAIHGEQLRFKNTTDDEHIDFIDKMRQEPQFAQMVFQLPSVAAYFHRQGLNSCVDYTVWFPLLFKTIAAFFILYGGRYWFRCCRLQRPGAHAYIYFPQDDPGLRTISSEESDCEHTEVRAIPETGHEEELSALLRDDILMRLSSGSRTVTSMVNHARNRLVQMKVGVMFQNETCLLSHLPSKPQYTKAVGDLVVAPGPLLPSRRDDSNSD